MVLSRPLKNPYLAGALRCLTFSVVVMWLVVWSAGTECVIFVSLLVQVGVSAVPVVSIVRSLDGAIQMLCFSITPWLLLLLDVVVKLGVLLFTTSVIRLVVYIGPGLGRLLLKLGRGVVPIIALGVVFSWCLRTLIVQGLAMVRTVLKCTENLFVNSVWTVLKLNSCLTRVVQLVIGLIILIATLVRGCLFGVDRLMLRVLAT